MFGPHSLHLSFQLRKRQLGHQKVLPLGFVKCLLVLGGGLEQRQPGRLWFSRVGYNEITQKSDGKEEFIFARTSRRKWYLGDDDIVDRTPTQATTWTQQYKFIRLEERANYEPLIMCLKGLQLAYNPADYLTADQLSSSTKLQKEYNELKSWVVRPTSISPRTIARFLETMQYGLLHERRDKPAHHLHYIDWAVSAVDVQLSMFNRQIKAAT